MISYIGIRASMVLFVRQSFFFEKKKKKRENEHNFFSLFLCVFFLCKFGMDGKILSRIFQCIIFFVIFEVLVDLLPFFKVLWKNGFF